MPFYVQKTSLYIEVSDTQPPNAAVSSDQDLVTTAIPHKATNISFTSTVAPLYLVNISTTIYFITPTYARRTQKVDLTSLCQTLMHVPKLVWIVVEDSPVKTALVTNLLSRCNVTSVHMNVESPDVLAIEQR